MRRAHPLPFFPHIALFLYSGGPFTAAECFEGEIVVHEWEFPLGADDLNVYSTSKLPFHLEVERIA